MGTAIGGTDLFLIKFDKNGNRQWTRQYGTGGTDIGYDVALDSTGNAYVTGQRMANCYWQNTIQMGIVSGYNSMLLPRQQTIPTMLLLW